MSFDRTGSSIIETQNILQNGCLEKVRGDVVMVVEKNEHDFIDSLSLSPFLSTTRIYTNAAIYFSSLISPSASIHHQAEENNAITEHEKLSIQ
jgi:hypothetical protein